MTPAALSLPRRAVFLDRDGVLNRAFVRDGVPHPPSSLEEFEVLPGAAEACEELRESGYVTVVVTNQPDIARRAATRAEVDLLNQELARLIPIDDIRVCPHDDGDGCSCRKPAPGLLLDAAADFGLDMPASVIVGDRWWDIEAGRRAGCRTVMIDHHYPESRSVVADNVSADLRGATRWILSQHSMEGGCHAYPLS